MENKLLLEDIQRIGFLMNYEVGKLISENEIKPQNVLVENRIKSLFPKIELITEASAWERQGDVDGYWKILFDQLTKGGIGVKWQIPNDPVKSTNMYWGPWVIWKDTNKNGGWPVTFTSTDKKLWLFRFKGGKYAGQPATNIIIESKFINSTFNLGQWGKVDMAKGTPQLVNLSKTKPKTGGVNVQGCTTTYDEGETWKPITAQQLPGVADKIFKELAYAFDGAGTYEAEAVAAFKMITCKPLFDAVNAKVKARGMKGINNVADWAKDEMSDYDYKQYREIWANLQKFGVKAPEVSQTMRAVGVVGDVVGVNALEKGAEGIQQLFSRPAVGFEKIVDAIWDFLGGVVGGIVTTILDFTGIGKVITSIGYGIALLGDLILQFVLGKSRWINIILGIVSIATTGAVGATVAKILKPLMGSSKSLAALVKFMSESKALGGIGKLIKNGLSKVGSMITGAIGWLTKQAWWQKYFAKSMVGTALSKVSGWASKVVTEFSEGLAKKAGAGTVSTRANPWVKPKAADLIKNPNLKNKLVKTAGQDIKQQITTDAAQDLGWAVAGEVGYDVGGDTGKNIVDLTKANKKIASNQGGLQSGQKKFNMSQKGSGYRGVTYSHSRDLASNLGKNVTGLTKAGKKTYETGTTIYDDTKEPTPTVSGGGSDF